MVFFLEVVEMVEKLMEFFGVGLVSKKVFLVSPILRCDMRGGWRARAPKLTAGT